MITQEMHSILNLYNKAMELYKQRKWQEAREYFRKVLEINEEDGPSLLYVERCDMYLNSPPPEDWDGVFTMTTK